MIAMAAIGGAAAFARRHGLQQARQNDSWTSDICHIRPASPRLLQVDLALTDSLLLRPLLVEGSRDGAARPECFIAPTTAASSPIIDATKQAFDFDLQPRPRKL